MRTHREGFQFIVILTPQGVPFHPVVVIGLGKNLLLKSVLGHCVISGTRLVNMKYRGQVNCSLHKIYEFSNLRFHEFCVYKPGPWQFSVLIEQWYQTCKHEVHRPCHQNYEIDINKHHHDCNTYADSSEKTNKLFLSLSVSNVQQLRIRERLGSQMEFNYCKVAKREARALYMGELRKNTTSTGPITKKTWLLWQNRDCWYKKIFL